MRRRAFLGTLASTSIGCGVSNMPKEPKEPNLVTLAPAPPKDPAVEPSRPRKPGRIATLFPLSGDRSWRGARARLGIDTAIEVLGPRHGLDFELIDTGSLELGAIKERLTRVDDFVGIFGELNSAPSRDIAALANELRIPMLTPASTEPGITELGPYAFRSCFIDGAQAIAAVRFMVKELGTRRLGLISVPGFPFAQILNARARKEAELQRLFHFGIAVTPQTTNFDGTVSAMKKNGCDVIYAPLDARQMLDLITSARKERFPVDRIVGSDAISNTDVFQAFEGGYFTDHFAADDPSRGTQRFTEAFRAADGSEPDSLVSSVYDGVLVLSDAVSRMVEPTRNALRDALAATRDIEGATGRFGIDTSRDADKSVVMVQVVRGRPTWRATISSSNPPNPAP